jgi:hypothetical protein
LNGVPSIVIGVFACGVAVHRSGNSARWRGFALGVMMIRSSRALQNCCCWCRIVREGRWRSAPRARTRFTWSCRRPSRIVTGAVLALARVAVKPRRSVHAFNNRFFTTKLTSQFRH